MHFGVNLVIPKLDFALLDYLDKEKKKLFQFDLYVG
jgi:hypothetical protein